MRSCIALFGRIWKDHSTMRLSDITGCDRTTNCAVMVLRNVMLIPDTIHSTKQYENNRAERSHESTRVREKVMRRFKSVRQAQRFLGAHAAVSNLFNLGRHLVSAEHYKNLRTSAFAEWRRAVV